MRAHKAAAFFASANNMGKWGFMDDNDGRFIGKVWRLRCKLHDYIVVHLSPIQSWSLRDFATLDTRVTITNGTWFLSLSMKDDGFSRMRVCNRSSRTIINHIRRTTELRRNFLYLLTQCFKKSWKVSFALKLTRFQKILRCRLCNAFHNVF